MDKRFVQKFTKEDIEIEEPKIPFSKSLLTKLSSNYILILGIPSVKHTYITIRNMRSEFGINPDNSEPCFYNQDWYLNEKFIDSPVLFGWHLIRKNVFEQSRAMDPNLLIETSVKFPSAVLCTYAFFSAWFAKNVKLWETDFIWTNDLDHNGDRIYVGKYTDVDGINKSGFSIHRHLALRPCYAAIDVVG